MADFIFMLTNADRTIDDAVARLPDIFAAGIAHIGFKDIGADFATLQKLTAAIRLNSATVYLEVVSLDARSEEASAQMAVELGVDILMGGTRPEVVIPILAGTKIRYYPFPGIISGSPSILVGDIDSIVESASRLVAHKGIHGLDLLAYRFHGDVPELMRRVIRVAGNKPVIMAGSIDRAERIAEVIGAGAAGFTIGTAALEGAFSGSRDLKSQLDTVTKIADIACLEYDAI
jgi:DhnA family fructose-bisphosphate aldolase class Ia